MIPGAAHRPPGIYLAAGENTGKPQLGNLDEDCATSHRLKWDPFPSTEVGRIAKHIRKGEGGKEGKGSLCAIILLSNWKGILTSTRESRQSRLMIWAIMRVYWGLCTDPLAFTLHLRKIPENLVRRPPIKIVLTVIALNGVPFLKRRSIGSHSTSGRKKKERTGSV
jgi:hypothetical protein